MKKDLTNGNMLENLIYFSLPYLLSCFLQTFYGLADLFIAGKYNGSATTTAISTGSQVMHMITVILVGLAMGSTVMISQAIGANEKNRVSKAIGNSISLFMILSILLTILLLFLIEPILSLLVIPKEATSEAKAYLFICFIGIPFITAYNVISCIFRGMGDSKTPMYFVAIACVINIIVDFLLMGPFHMGAAGAAFGTVISQTASVIFSILTIRKRDFGIQIKKSDFSIKKDVIHSILHVGVPISLQDGLIQVSFIMITIIANSRGLIIATAVGIVEKIIGFLFLIPSAMLSSISAIAAQNIGAGKCNRARESLKYGLIISVVFGIIVSILFQFIAEPVVGLFSTDSEVISMGADYLHSYVFDCALAGIHFCFSGFFCAHGKSVISFIHNITSIIAIRIPGAFLASIWFPETLFEMGLAAPLGSLLSAIICIVFYIILRNKRMV